MTDAWSNPPESMWWDGERLRFDTAGTPLDMEWSCAPDDLLALERGAVIRAHVARAFGDEVLAELVRRFGGDPAVLLGAPLPPPVVVRAPGLASAAQRAPTGSAAPISQGMAGNAPPDDDLGGDAASSLPGELAPVSTPSPLRGEEPTVATTPPLPGEQSPFARMIALAEALARTPGLPPLTLGSPTTSSHEVPMDGASGLVESHSVKAEADGVTLAVTAETSWWNPHTPASESITVALIDRRAGYRALYVSAEPPWERFDVRTGGEPLLMEAELEAVLRSCGAQRGR